MHFFAGFGSLRNSSLESADRECCVAGCLPVSWSPPCVSICPGAEDDKRTLVGWDESPSWDSFSISSAINALAFYGMVSSWCPETKSHTRTIAWWIYCACERGLFASRRKFSYSRAICVVYEDMQRLCYAIFLRGLAHTQCLRRDAHRVAQVRR